MAPNTRRATLVWNEEIMHCDHKQLAACGLSTRNLSDIQLGVLFLLTGLIVSQRGERRMSKEKRENTIVFYSAQGTSEQTKLLHYIVNTMDNILLGSGNFGANESAPLDNEYHGQIL